MKVRASLALIAGAAGALAVAVPSAVAAQAAASHAAAGHTPAVADAPAAARTPETARTSETAHLRAAAVAPVVRVSGEVSSPTSYTQAELAKLPRTRFRAFDGCTVVTDTGVALDRLVDDARPAYPTTLKNTRNEMVRVTVTVTGASGSGVTFALGELVKDFGSHPAYLALTQGGKQMPHGPELVVPGDSGTLRWIHHVRRVTIGIASASATDTSPPAGSPLEVIEGRKVITLSAARLAHLPAEALTVSFSGPKGMETKTETGPSLLAVLHAARVTWNPDTTVTAVGDDNYTVVVTPDEQVVGHRKLQLSLVQDKVRLPQPRLVPDGDFYGDRFDYDLVDLYVGSGPAS